jgi:protein-tyrosine phosphatase
METDDLPRVVPMRGTSNCRDLGGWQTRDGGVVRFGQVFRSAELSKLTHADQARLQALGIGDFIDLRGKREAASALPRLERITGARRHAMPIEPSVGASLADLVATGRATGEGVMAVLARAYRAYAIDCIAAYRGLFDLLLAPAARPVLFHCHAGKDRTGFGAALILAALDVPWESIEADYLASNRLWHHDGVSTLPPEAAAVLLGVHLPLLRAAFASVDETHGSLDRYLREAIGLTPERREALRARLLE